VTATITIQGRIVDLALDGPGHTAYVTGGSDNTVPVDGTVSVIDTRSNTVIDTIAVGETPSYVAVDESIHTAYVTNSVENGTVSVIDTRSNKVTDTILVGIRPGAIAVDGSAHTAYVANSSDGTVSVVNPQTHKVATIHVGVALRVRMS
jgi:YVTN family beta-propeller protein